MTETSLQRMTTVELPMDLGYDAKNPKKAEAWLVTAEALLDEGLGGGCSEQES